MVKNISSKLHQWLKIPYRLHMRSVGNGPAIIMLHGIATSSASWQHLVPYLKQDFRCITIDLLGFGNSPKPDWYSYTPDEHAKNIHYTISKLNLREPYLLVGHSMGSLLALHYANKYPQKIKQLFLLSPPIYLTKNDAEKARKIWRDALYARAYKYIRSHKKFTLKGVRGLKVLALKNNPFSITEETWLAFSKSLEECIEKQNVVKDLEHVRCPVNIFYGTLDRLLIKNNIRSMSTHSNLNLYSLKNGHFISDKYARLVAECIMQNNLAT
jgi:pimeloyl-ACP methyl ester carboxylesterase